MQSSIGNFQVLPASGGFGNHGRPLETLSIKWLADVSTKELLLRPEPGNPRSCLVNASTVSIMAEEQFPTNESIISKKQLVLFEVLDSGDMSYFLSLCKLVTDDVIASARDKRPLSEGRTLLHNISLCNHTNSLVAMRYLIDTGVDVNAIDCSVSLRTPLMDAVATVNIEKVLCLVEAGADIGRRDASGDSAFHYAAKTGIAMLIRKLIEMSMAKQTSMQQIQIILATPNVKKKLPEDMAANQTCKDLLAFLRMSGAFPPRPERRVKKGTK